VSENSNVQIEHGFEGDPAMVALENELIAEIGDSAKVDGHDVGIGETNI
jgi:hypothetical protein